MLDQNQNRPTKDKTGSSNKKKQIQMDDSSDSESDEHQSPLSRARKNEKLLASSQKAQFHLPVYKRRIASSGEESGSDLPLSNNKSNKHSGRKSSGERKYRHNHQRLSKQERTSESERSQDENKPPGGELVQVQGASKESRVAGKETKRKEERNNSQSNSQDNMPELEPQVQMTHSPRKHQVDPSLSSETANKPISPSKTKTSPLIKTIPNSEKSPTKTLVSPRDTRITSKSDILHLPQKHISTPTMVNTKSKQISIESFIQKSTTTTTATASSLTQSVHISPTATVSSVSPRVAAASKLLKSVTSPYVPNNGSVLEKTEKGVVILDKGQREAIESNFSLNQGYLTAFESFTSTLGHDKSKPTLRPDIASS